MMRYFPANSKTILLIAISLIFTFTEALHAQSGIVQYKKKSSHKSEEEVDNELVKAAITLFENQDYQLIFNKNGGLFKMLEHESIENNSVVEAMAEGFANFSGEAYFNKNGKKVIRKTDFAGSTYLIEKDKIEWTLSKDSKRIDNYVCYKATTNRTIENSTGTYHIIVTAWYSPEIDLPYGPDGYGGLPGLILQLDNNGTLTTLKNIEYLEDKNLNIDVPVDGKKVSEKEFNDVAAEANKNRG